MKLSLKQVLAGQFSALVVALFLATSGAHAATLNVVGGQLMGASGVNVGGNLYDVQFVDGTCIALFSGCDSAADFPFNNLARAIAASQALLDQVFTDGVDGPFDSQSHLTSGCIGAPQFCSVYTPYAMGVVLSGPPPQQLVNMGRGLNYSAGGGPDVVTFDAFVQDFDTTYYSEIAYAIWTPVPEPSTGLLMGLGLAGLAGVLRKHT